MPLSSLKDEFGCTKVIRKGVPGRGIYGRSVYNKKCGAELDGFSFTYCKKHKDMARELTHKRRKEKRLGNK